tara:strand:- start:1304 stop:1762 length:459 start_codon:yes stop_codon:yes gene_type:complete
MIIVCPSCEKKFEIDGNLIPKKGRLLKCGSCNQTWFFHDNDLTDKTMTEKLLSNEQENIENNDKITKESQKQRPKLAIKKGSELVKYKSKSNFTFGKFLSYLIVLIISFIALIIIIDTFKSPLSVIYPNLELILYNLFETLRDLILFAKDLN